MGRRLFGVFLLLLLPGMLSAQSNVPEDNASAMYSHGVHGYFSGNLHRAEMYLLRAEELNPNDPRPYYFRGLVLMRLGRSWEADAVIQQGATVEATSDASAYGIGEALLRVQGSDRLRLEKVRREARQAHSSHAAENAKRRYEQLERRQAVVQRQPIRLPLDALVNPLEPSQVAAVLASGESSSAVASTTESSAMASTEESSEELVTADAGDPFTDDPVESTAAPPAGVVPARSLPGIFGRMGRKLTGSLIPGSGMVDNVREMVPEMPGGVEGNPPESEENPFGAPAENPAGMSEENPFGPPEENPFGGPGDAGDFPEMPADAEENPF